MVRLVCLIIIFSCVIVTVVQGAAQKTPTKKAEERAKALREHPEAFQLRLVYHGPQDKPFYGMTLSVEPVDQLAKDPFHPIVLINEDQAKRIIDHLVTDGFFDQATDPRVEKKPLPTTPGYSLTVSGQSLRWQAELGWNLAMLHRLDGLQTALDGKAAESMKILIGRLSGYRREWEKASLK